MKKVFFIVATIFTICVLLVSCNTKDENGGLQFVPLDDGTYEVYSTVAKDVTEVTIPSTYNGKPVTSIGDFAFFNCKKLTKVTIPSSVTNIGDSAFHGCTALTGVEIPDSVTSIGNAAFYGSGLESIQIPASVKHIGESAFEKCTKLNGVEIPNS